MRTSQAITSFNAGEWSPQMYGRADMAKYFNACRNLKNFICRVHGGAQRRPGLRYIAGTKTNGSASRLIPFQQSQEKAYALEFGDEYIRVFRDKGQVCTSGTIAYEITSPYLAADLWGIRYIQDADIMYLFHPDYPPYQLSRTGDADWTIDPVDFTDGPYLDENEVEDVGVNLCPDGDMESDTGWASVGTPTTQERSSDRAFEGAYSRKFTIDASGEGVKSGVFTTTTDKLYRLRFKVWSAAKNVAFTIRKGDDSGDLFTDSISSLPDQEWTEYERYYKETAGGAAAYVKFTNATGTTGTWYIDQVEIYEIDTILITPSAVTGTITLTASASLFESTHEGALWRLKWTEEEYGHVLITDYTSGTAVTATVIAELPKITPTPLWREGAWSTKRGFPSCGTFYEQRLCAACTAYQPQTIWGSRPTAYTDFTPGVLDTDAFTHTIKSDQVQYIRWLTGLSQLMVGTSSGEWRLGGTSTAEPLTPSSVRILPQSRYGSADLHPISMGYAVLFLQRNGDPTNSGKILRELTYRLEYDTFIGANLSKFVDHIAIDGIFDLAFMSSPFPILWGLRDNNGVGELVGLTYEKDEDVLGWHQHTTDGSIESICVIAGEFQDEVWAIIKRTVNGSTVRYVEVLEDFDWGSDQADCFFVDCGATYDATPTDVISGLDYLEGETVKVLVDGAEHPDRTVVSGIITLEWEGSVVQVGLPYVSDCEPLDLEGGAMEGAPQGKLKRVHSVAIRFYETMGGYKGQDSSSLEPIIYRDTLDNVGEAIPLYTGLVEASFTGGWDAESRILIRQTAPLPMTILSIIARYRTEEK